MTELQYILCESLQFINRATLHAIGTTDFGLSPDKEVVEVLSQVFGIYKIISSIFEHWKNIFGPFLGLRGPLVQTLVGLSARKNFFLLLLLPVNYVVALGLVPLTILRTLPEYFSCLFPTSPVIAASTIILQCLTNWKTIDDCPIRMCNAVFRENQVIAKHNFVDKGKSFSQIIVDFKLYFQLLLCLSFIQQFCNIGQIELWSKNIFHVIKAIDYKLLPYQKMQGCFRGESGYCKTN